MTNPTIEQLPKPEVCGLTIALWFAVAVVFTFMIMIVAPGRGAAWTDDDPFFLSMSWHVVNGFGLDLQLPQTPSYLVNALFMKTGVHELLHFRYINYIFILLSSSIFFLGIDVRRWRSPVVPIAICASLLVSLDSVQNPNSLSLAFFLAGAGTYFFSLDATRGMSKFLLLSLAAILFGIAGFMHAAVAVSMIVVVALVSLISRPQGRRLFWISFFTTSILFWTFYIWNLGLKNFLNAPVDHDSSIHYLLFRAGLIALFYAEAAIAYVALAGIGNRRNLTFAHITLITAATSFYGVSLLAYVFNFTPPLPFPIHGVFLLSSEGQWVSRVLGGLSFFVMLFTAFRWLSYGLTESARKMDRKRHRLTERALQAFRFLSKNNQSRKWTLALCGMALLQASLAVGSNTSISQGMVFLAGPAFGLAIVIWEQLLAGKAEKLFFGVTCLSWIIFCALFTFTYNHSSNEPILTSNHVVLNFDNLHGIEETPRFNFATKKLLNAYEAGNCAAKPFITLIYLPGTYYLLQHPYPRSIGVIRPAFGFPEKKLRSILALPKGWCVLDGSEKEIDLSIAERGKDNREPFREWVISNSQKTFDIPSPTPGLEALRLYVRGSIGS